MIPPNRTRHRCCNCSYLKGDEERGHRDVMLSRSLRARLVLAVSAAAGAVMAAHAQTPVPDRAAPARPAVLRVESVDQLAAVTPEEKELAGYFRGCGEVLGPDAVRQPCPIATPVVTPPWITPRDLLRDHVCSGVVVVGAPVSHRVILSATGRGMVSVYRIAVSRWIVPAAGESELVAGEGGGQAFVQDFLYESGRPRLWLNGPSIFVLHRGRRAGTLRVAYALGPSSRVFDGHTSFEGINGSVDDVTDDVRALALECDAPSDRISSPLHLQVPEGR